jgi:hypothetical protein
LPHAHTPLQYALEFSRISQMKQPPTEQTWSSLTLQKRMAPGAASCDAPSPAKI